MQVYLPRLNLLFIREAKRRRERVGKGWKTISTGLDISFAAIFYYSAIKLALTNKWAIPTPSLECYGL